MCAACKPYSVLKVSLSTLFQVFSFLCLSCVSLLDSFIAARHFASFRVEDGVNAISYQTAVQNTRTQNAPTSFSNEDDYTPTISTGHNAAPSDATRHHAHTLQRTSEIAACVDSQLPQEKAAVPGGPLEAAPSSRAASSPPTSTISLGLSATPPLRRRTRCRYHHRYCYCCCCSCPVPWLSPSRLAGPRQRWCRHDGQYC